MVSNPEKIWIGLEYFCDEGDEIWSLSETEMIELAKYELDIINIIDKNFVEDAIVIKMPKTYPSYVGAYDEFDILKNYCNQFENLFLIGRNGMHKYNNQDHSMLTAMQAVQNIKNGVTDKNNIWNINIDDEYHEEK
jgi:protoporphyrinogen oxidase